MITVALILALISGVTTLSGLLAAYSGLDDQTYPETADTRLQRVRLWFQFVHRPARSNKTLSRLYKETTMRLRQFLTGLIALTASFCAFVPPPM